MQFNQSIRHAFRRSVLTAVRDFRIPMSRVTNHNRRVRASLDRTEPKPKTKEDHRGWAVKLSFGTHRKLVNQGYEVL